jgi:hypothetical protein
LIQCCKTIRLTEGDKRGEEKEINKEGKTEGKGYRGRHLAFMHLSEKFPQNNV